MLFEDTLWNIWHHSLLILSFILLIANIVFIIKMKLLLVPDSEKEVHRLKHSASINSCLVSNTATLSQSTITSKTGSESKESKKTQSITEKEPLKPIKGGKRNSKELKSKAHHSERTQESLMNPALTPACRTPAVKVSKTSVNEKQKPAKTPAAERAMAKTQVSQETVSVKLPRAKRGHRVNQLADMENFLNEEPTAEM